RASLPRAGAARDRLPQPGRGRRRRALLREALGARGAQVRVRRGGRPRARRGGAGARAAQGDRDGTFARGRHVPTRAGTHAPLLRVSVVARQPRVAVDAEGHGFRGRVRRRARLRPDPPRGDAASGVRAVQERLAALPARRRPTPSRRRRPAQGGDAPAPPGLRPLNEETSCVSESSASWPGCWIRRTGSTYTPATFSSICSRSTALRAT